MARWSDAMRLCEYRLWKKDILYPGVYEIGFVRDGVFSPKYVGKASNRIYDRIKKHYNEVGSLFAGQAIMMAEFEITFIFTS